MEHLTKVVWSEGMYLAPHHFQAQSRFFERSIHFVVSSLWSNAFGLTVCEMDDEALKGGAVSVLRAEGIFPDGLSFQIPASDALSLRRDMKECFDPARDSMDVLLAIAPDKAGEPVIGRSDDTAGNARYIAETHALYDQNTGRDGKPVQLARKNIHLLFDFEAAQQDVITIPVARVIRRLSGQLEYDPNFVPPCLKIDASPRLSTLLASLISALEDKNTTLGNARRAKNQPITQFAAREIAQFWLLHTVNSGIACLRHVMTKKGHAEELFLELSRLGGALCTFLVGSSPQTLPSYDHQNATACFQQLETHIYKHLEVIFPEDWVAVPLSLVKDCYYAGDIADERWLGRSRWIFGIRSAAGDADTISKTPRAVRICSSAFVERLVNNALNGLALTHLPTPPANIPSNLESKYFGITKAGPCWEHIVQTRRIGIHVPAELPRPELELFIAFDNEDSAS